SSANMDAYGNFSWTPTDTDGGVHTFTITVSDSAGNPSATASQTITVQSPTNISITNPQPGATVAASSTLTFTISKVGLTNPAYRIVDSFYNSTLSASNLSSSGSFSWTPTQTDIGTHDLTIFATDIYQRTALTTFSVHVTRIQAPAATSTPTSTLQGSMPATITPTTSPSSHYVFSKYLYLGLTHPDVKKMQERLTALGFYSGPVTGYFGSLTQVAVKKFQAARGLEQVGSVGPATRKALSQ
ncbi:peptidoglycan-binding protein, partial [Patescibacteria group bacterium]|nr:peptidoglycan-binding protein [Patescibacteria group bacterium]